MNLEFPQNEREQLEAKLTAFLLGELPPDEVVALCKAMESDAELAALYEKLKLTIGFVRESAAKTEAEAESQATLKLSEEKREKLLAQFKTIAPKEFVKPRRLVDRLVPWAVAAAVVVALGSIAIPNFIRSRDTARKNSIVNNLRLLDGAESQWALENRSRSNAVPTMAELKVYMGRGGDGLSPIAGEKYVPGKVSGLPSVEMNVADAKRVFGPQIVAGGAESNGKVILSLDNVQGAISISGTPAQQDVLAMTRLTRTPSQAKPPVSTAGAVSTGRIVLPAENQVADLTKEPAMQQPRGEQTNYLAFNSDSFNHTFNPQTSYRELSRQATQINARLASGEYFVTNGGSQSQPSAGSTLTWGLHNTNTLAAGFDETFGTRVDGVITGPIVTTKSMSWANADTIKENRSWGTDSSVPAQRGNQKSEIVLPDTPGFGGAGGAGAVSTLKPSVATASAEDMGVRFSPTTGVPVAQTPPALTLEEQDKKVAAAQQKVDELRDKLHISDAAAAAPDPSPLMTADRLKELASIRVQKEADYNQEASLLEKLKGMSPDERKKALSIAVQDGQLNSLESELDLAQQNLIRLKTDYAPNNPKYESAQNLVNDLNKKVDERVDGIMLGLESKVTASKAFLDTLSNDVAAAQRADIEYGSNAAPYFAAKEQLENEKRWRQILAMRTGAEEVDKDLPRARTVTIVDPAVANRQGPTNLWGKIREAFTGKVESTARIDVEQEHPDISGLGTGPRGTSYDPYFLLTEFETIQSDAVLSKVIDAMDLQDKWGKKYNDGKPMSKADVEARIKRQLELKPVRNTKFIDISAYSDDPQEAAKLANQIAASYKQYRDEEYEELKNHGIKNLQDQLTEQDKKVQLAQAKVDELAKQLDISGEADRALPKPAVPPPTPQPEILTRENAFSTFSLNVSDVSFKLAAASLEKGQMPEPASIRSEEFINAFDYRDPEAPAGVPIAFASERARYPFAHNRELLRFSLKTAAAGRQAGRPLNIVLLLDNSGSMERADRVRIIQEALRVLAGQLNARDTFSIVTFARTAQLRVDGVSGDKAGAAAAKVAGLTPEGGTNLGDALDLAYEIALKHYLANGDNRVVLLTDGAANLGDVNPDALKQKVEAHRKQGVALDCFGIGWEDYNDDLLEVLTRNGDGRYGFINSPEEASTTFVSQIAGALHVAAQDVKVQVEFNPKRVISYRQIGYAKHQLTKEQFRDNTVDAAEIAAQEAGNALYTIEINPQGEGSVATVRVRYKVPGTSDYREQAWDVPYTGGAVALEQASPAMRLAATASAFSEWLATSPFADEVSTDALLKYLNGVPQVYGADKRPAKLEWMIRQAKSISGK